MTDQLRAEIAQIGPLARHRIQVALLSMFFLGFGAGVVASELAGWIR